MSLSGYFTWTYFVQSSLPPYLVKIGRTAKRPKTRIGMLRSQCPIDLSIVLLLKGAVSLEQSLHRVFCEYRAHGEWFRPRGELAAFIKRCREAKIDYFGPRTSRLFLPEPITPEDVTARDFCIEYIDLWHKEAIRNYPWLKDVDLEKTASRMVSSTHDGSSAPVEMRA